MCRKQAEVTQNHEMNTYAAKDKEKPYIENIRGLHLAVVKLMTVQVTKLPL
jgi:hypothetical protein